MSGYPHDCMLLESCNSDSLLYPPESNMVKVKCILNA